MISRGRADLKVGPYEFKVGPYESSARRIDGPYESTAPANRRPLRIEAV